MELEQPIRTVDSTVESTVESMAESMEEMVWGENLPDLATLPGIDEGEIIVVRSRRRKKHISAYRQGGRIVISIPARMSKADERAIVPEMIAKVRAMETSPLHSEDALQAKADELLTALAPEILRRPVSIQWRTMRERWGSCTSEDGTIRLSDRLKAAPEYVLEFVLFHELIHLKFSDHGSDFTATLARFAKSELAQAYLDGYEAAETALIPPKIPHLTRKDG